MNISRIKTYAIQARKDFIKAITERANIYGIFSDENIEKIELKGDTAIIGERAFPKREGTLREKLADRVKKDGFSMVVRASAYSWFNRFIALRYMEIHDYLEHGYRVLSNNGDLTIIPEILEHAADVQFQGLDKDRVIELKLAGTKDNELYRLLILAQCNDLHKSMPFLFDSIDNETALLLPDNLLHSDSPIRKMVTEIDESDWNDVEIIGWIYQFYISERKDEVIGKVVKSEDIPAATQLFTPNWIVKYMVQNTLGRMWLATYPDSRLKDKMEYYIEPAEQEPDVQKQIDEITPKELNPEEITFLDPACGSGHILVEAYDVFKEIYLERGYRTRDIPHLIIEKNIFGLDICDRAAQLAYFAVLMKAREDDRRILGRDDLKLNIMAIQESDKSYLKNIEIFFKDDAAIMDGLTEIIKLFENAKTFGSLITVPENLAGKRELFETAIQQNIDEVFRVGNVERLKALLRQMEILEKQYDCVVTNPPYMGGKGMNGQIKAFLKSNYADVKSDLFSAFIVRNTKFAQHKGQLGFMTPFVWMFISSYEKLRDLLINQKTISSLVQLEYSGFDGATVPICTFTIENTHHPDFKGGYIRLSDFRGAENQRPKTLEAIKNPDCGWFYRASAADFKKIPGSPIAYWVSERVRSAFVNGSALSEIAEPRKGITTADNDKYLRLWHEIPNRDMEFNAQSNNSHVDSKKKWFPVNKGGDFRKWYGNKEIVIEWLNNGISLKNFKNSVIRNPSYYFREGMTWNDISSGKFAMRYSDGNSMFEGKGPMAFTRSSAELRNLIAFFNSKVSASILSFLCPTLNFNIGEISKTPIIAELLEYSATQTNSIGAIQLAQSDWDSYETSWDFTSPPLLQPDHHKSTLKATYAALRTHWRNITLEMQSLEKENNRIFIKAYGLQDELTPDVPLSEITLTCNPHYRYNDNKTEEELETLLLTDTIKELISYAIGCMMGRYSLDHPGLIYAHSGNIDFDPSKYKTFPVDDDGIIPIMDQDWFPDDTASRFVEFLKVAWPPETLDENLKFIATTLKHRQNETPVNTIRRYLSAGFFKDHLKTYKKRPIYWLFSSGKQKAFECLVYLHRYNESTLSRMRSAYVTPLQGNFSARLEFLRAERDVASTTSAKNKFQKEINKLKKKQSELSGFDEELRHYADMKISLDLDDGVKVNYGKFGNLLAETKAITGKK
jgi:type II restriction/modification system DNA methylase subunit YeeA